MNDKYILEGHKAVPADLMTWASWFEAAGDSLIVAETDIAHVSVSTVFLGLHRFSRAGPPQIFETMIFGGPEDGWQERCATWEEAEALHQRAIAVAEAAFESDRGAK
jgi:hypothetical protein